MKTRSMLMPICMTASLAMAAPAVAEPHIEYSIPLDWALSVAKTASDVCAEMGFSTTVTVVDQRAQARVQLMKEGAFPHTVHTSTRKAVTAASRREATAIIEAENAHEPSLGATFNEIGLTTLSGGIPILYKGKVIGGVGVAGAPGEDDQGRDFDDQCAMAGLQTIADKLK